MGTLLDLVALMDDREALTARADFLKVIAWYINNHGDGAPNEVARCGEWMRRDVPALPDRARNPLSDHCRTLPDKLTRTDWQALQKVARREQETLDAARAGAELPEIGAAGHTLLAWLDIWERALERGTQENRWSGLSDSEKTATVREMTLGGLSLAALNEMLLVDYAQVRHRLGHKADDVKRQDIRALLRQMPECADQPINDALDMANDRLAEGLMEGGALEPTEQPVIDLDVACEQAKQAVWSLEDDVRRHANAISPNLIPASMEDIPPALRCLMGHWLPLRRPLDWLREVAQDMIAAGLPAGTPAEGQGGLEQASVVVSVLDGVSHRDVDVAAHGGTAVATGLWLLPHEGRQWWVRVIDLSDRGPTIDDPDIATAIIVSSHLTPARTGIENSHPDLGAGALMAVLETEVSEKRKRA